MVERIGAAKTPIIIAGSGTEYAGARRHSSPSPKNSRYRSSPRIAVWRTQRSCALPGQPGSANNHAQQAVAGADLVLAIGTRLNQQSTAGYTLPQAGQALIQIDPAEEVIGQNHRPTIGIVADVKLALTAALEYPAPQPKASRQGWIDEYRQVQQAWATPPERPTSKVSMEKVMLDMKTTLPGTPFIPWTPGTLPCGCTSTRSSVRPTRSSAQRWGVWDTVCPPRSVPS